MTQPLPELLAAAQQAYADTPPAIDVYEAPVRAMLAPYPDGVGTVTYDRLFAVYVAHDDYRRLIDAARAPLLAEIDRLRHQLRCADARIAELAAS